MIVSNLDLHGFGGHACECCCPQCSTLAPMDPSAQVTTQASATPTTYAASITPAGLFDKSATLGDLATLMGVLSALFYLFGRK